MEYIQPDVPPKSGIVESIWRLSLENPEKFDIIAVSKLNTVDDNILQSMLHKMQKVLKLI